MITAACGNLFHFEDGKVRCMAKYEKWLKEENILLIQSWARDGLTDEQIAHNMGISYSTLREWKIKFPALSAALKKGKEVIDAAVESALLKQALDGNLGAICFWLKNRKPDKWRDKPPEQTGEQKRRVIILNDAGDSPY